MLTTASLPRVVSIHIGKVAPLGPDRVPSGFIKQVVQGPVTVAPEGLIGDEQADLASGSCDDPAGGNNGDLFYRLEKKFPAGGY